MGAFPSQTEAEHRLASSMGAHASWGRTKNRTERTAPGRAAFEQRFMEQADGDPVRAAHLRKAYFAALALKSAKARRRARELTETADAAEAELTEAGGPLVDGAA